MENKDFIRVDGEIKVGDFFKSKSRTENKFCHYVQVKEITDKGYIDNSNGWLHYFDDVEYKAILKTNVNPILDLCNKILNVGAIYEYNSNDSDYTRCPFCLEFEYGINGSIHTIEHDKDCGYLLADNLKNNLCTQE